MQEVHQQYSYSVCSGFDAGVGALVEVLQVVVFRENGQQRVMALRDSGCHTTLMDESLAVTLGLKGKEMDLEMQGVNSQRVFTSKHIKKYHVARVGKEEVRYQLRDVKTMPNLTGPDQRLKWSTIKYQYSHLKDLDIADIDSGPMQLISGTNNSNIILPKRIVKSSEYSGDDRVPYGVETILGWAITNWLPGD